MKSLSVSLGLVALACVLVSTSADLRDIKPLMPLMPTLEERQKQMNDALLHPDPARRLPRPVAGFKGSRVRLTDDQAVPVSAPANKARANFLFQKPDATIKAQREPQPDFAGRVDVKPQPQPQDGDLKIINGQKAALGQFPWQAGILMDLSDTSKGWCGGSIIHSLWILTAGHCVDDQPRGYTVSVGSLGSEEGSEPTRQVFSKLKETYQHPTYNPYYIDNDIAFIKLPSHIEFSAYTRPVRLPSYTMATDMMVGKSGIVSGWGLRHDSDKWISPELMYVDNTIDDGSACFGVYGNSWIPNKICVKTPKAHSFCSGDSGGAFTIEEEPGVHTQLGIVSFGASAGCELGYPTAYTRLTSFLDFVEDTTNIAIRD